MEVSGLAEIIASMRASAVWGQDPAVFTSQVPSGLTLSGGRSLMAARWPCSFLPERPQGSPAQQPWWPSLLVTVIPFVH